ncbi:MAG: hypothetical protein IPJ06_06385 [Saprospiraceae bacterium]|nr:hypothetical protein [Saprospiraceae bacterium]
MIIGFQDAPQDKDKIKPILDVLDKTPVIQTAICLLAVDRLLLLLLIGRGDDCCVAEPFEVVE